MTMRKTLDRKIEELKENIGKLSFDELEKLASEIVALSTMLGCKKEVLGELTEYFEEKLGLSEGTVVDVERTDYRDVILLEVKSKLSAEVICDLVEDMAAEQKARVVYDNLIRLIDDPDILEPLKFLREREIVHFQRFGEALNMTQEKLDHKNVYAFNPAINC